MRYCSSAFSVSVVVTVDRDQDGPGHMHYILYVLQNLIKFSGRGDTGRNPQ